MKASKTILAENPIGQSLSNDEMNIQKAVLVSMLKDLREACAKRNISFYLFFGTLLGSIRHSGFIPWDDDIDVAIDAEDLLKVKAAVEEDYPDKYFFTGLGLDSFEDPFAGLKMNLAGTSIVEASAEGYPFVRGINIDLFPIRNVPKGIRRKMNGIKYKTLCHLLAFSYEYKYPPERLLTFDGAIGRYYKKRRVIGFFAHLIPRRYLMHRLRKTIFHKPYKNGGIAVEMQFGTMSKNLIRQNVFCPAKMSSFENEMFPIPSDSELCLRECYGDRYMELPSPDKRETHSFISVDFGQYQFRVK